MPVPFLTSGIKSASGHAITSLSLDYATAGGSNDPNAPAPNTVDYCWLAIIFLRIDTGGVDRTMSAPSGWTSEASCSGAVVSGVPGIRGYVFSKPYDGSTGSQTFTASGECLKIEGVMVLGGSISLASPVTISQSAGNDTGTVSSHATSSITPDYANSLILAAWLTGDTSGEYNLPAGMSDLYSSHAQPEELLTGSLATLIATAAQPAIAAVSKTATSKNWKTGSSLSVAGAAMIASINPSQLPSKPDIIAPNGGESYVAGISVAISWIAALSEVVASSSLKYRIWYSPDNGNTWVQIVSLTSPGVTTHSWSTSGLTVGSQYKIKIAATSDDGTTFGPEEISSNTFSLVAETTPGKPVSVHVDQPAGTAVTVVDRQSGVRAAWTHAQQSSNPQTTYTGRWSYNSDMSSPTAFNPGTGTNQFHDFAANTFNHGATVYVQVRTTGLTLQSDWSDPVSFVASNKPAVNITAPTAGSPPTTSFPTITIAITSGDIQQRRYRFTQGGNQVYDSGFVASTQLSFVSGYSLANGVEYVLLVSIKNQYDLASDEDSETFTPSFSAPAEPTIEVTALDALGCIQISITNSDTPDENQILRDGLMIAEGVAVDGVFLDFNVRHGTEYEYVVRAVNATGFTDSDPASDTLTLDRFWLSVLTKTSPTSNATLSVGLLNQAPSRYGEGMQVQYPTPRGLRLLPLALMPPRKQQSLSCTALLPASDQTTQDAIEDAYRANTDVCARDQFGSMVKGKLRNLSIQTSDANVVTISFDVAESDYLEDVA